jgi:hypothetical protein
MQAQMSVAMKAEPAADTVGRILACVDKSVEDRLCVQLAQAMRILDNDVERRSARMRRYWAYVKKEHYQALANKDAVQLTYFWLIHVWGTRRYRKFLIDQSPDVARLENFLALLDVVLPAFISAHRGGVRHNFLDDPTMRLSEVAVPVYDSVAALVCALKLFYVMN